MRASEMPPASTRTWRLLPGLPRSVGFELISSPPFRRHGGAVERAPAPVDRVRPAQAVEEHAVESGPDAGRLPVLEPAPAGHARATAHLTREHRLGDAALEHE